MKWLFFPAAFLLFWVWFVGYRIDTMERQHRAETTILMRMIHRLRVERDSLRDLRETRDWHDQRRWSMITANVQWLNFFMVKRWPRTARKLDSFNEHWEDTE